MRAQGAERIRTDWRVRSVVNPGCAFWHLRAPDEVTSVRAYDSVVIGSAVYVGQWREPARDLIERLGSELAERPLWLFSSGPVGDPSRTVVQKMGADPVDLPAMMRATRAREHRMFAGRLERHHLSRRERVALAIFKNFEGDFRPWGEIENWADKIYAETAAATADTRALALA